jgi:Uma2 family endonuclease
MTNGSIESAWYPGMVMSKPPARGRYTLEDWLAQPEEARLELVDGELIQKAAPTFEHSSSQGGLIDSIRGPFNRRGGAGGPGGWWIGPEVDIRLGGNGFRPDVAGWRRDRHIERPSGFPVTARPDWICEVLSASNRTHDTVVKLGHYHDAGVGHYWTLDGDERTLTVYRHSQEGYLVVLRATAGMRVRAEPFDAIELHVAVLLGDDPDE